MTSPAPASPAAPSQRRLRPQNETAASALPADPKRRKLLVGAGAAVALTLAVGAVAVSFGKSGPARAPATALAANPDALPAAAARAAATPAGAFESVPPAMAATPSTGLTGASGQRPGVIANVPLFGPTPMATLEPAPLGPAPDQIAAAAPGAKSPGAATEERMDEDDKGASDESFGGDSKPDDGKKKSADALAEDVKPWGQGKMHLPLLHRLKLDKPGTAILGKKEASGFTVVVPGRKVEGGGGAIAKRDDRIAEVRTKNGPSGAQITFIFRSKIPGYKVRLKKSSVEFFISSPDNAK